MADKAVPLFESPPHILLNIQLASKLNVLQKEDHPH
jgi:hypothetical protein